MIGFTNYTLFRDDIKKHGIEFAARHSAEIGFDSVEFLDVVPSTIPLISLLGSPERVKQILDGYGLSVACYSVAVQLLSDNQDEAEQKMMEQIDFAAKLGAPMIHHTLVPNLVLGQDALGYDQVLDKIFASADRIAQYCNKRGMTCIYEPQGLYFNGVDGLKPFFDKIKGLGREVGFCADFGNSAFVDAAPEVVFEAFSEHIKHVHIKDYLITDSAAEDRAPTAFRSRSGKWIYEADFGCGSLHLDACFDILKRIRYDGKISLEFMADDSTLQTVMNRVRDVFNACAD